MSKSPDLADQHRAGTMPGDPKANVVPLNAAARRKAEEEPRVHTVADLLTESMGRALSKREVNSYCTTGVRDLDRATGGLRPGFGWVFGADTSWGKSSFLIMLADENIRRGKKVLIVSNEDAPRLYGDRLMARRAQVNALRLRDRELTSEEQDKVKEVVRQAERVPVYLDARINRNVEWVVKHVEKLIVDEQIDLIAYDYLQQFTTKAHVQDERVKFRDIASELRGVVKKHDKASIIFSQITISETKKYPDKNSIRESRDVAHGAEVILLGFTPSEPVKSSKTSEVRCAAGERALLLDKVKDGPRGICLQLDWDENSASFISERQRRGRLAEPEDSE